MEPDPFKYFRPEARDLLADLGKGILDLEKGARLPDLIPRLLRLAHTLKGAARVVKQKEIAEMAHGIEEALQPLRDTTSPPARARIDEILALLDGIAARLAALGQPTPPATDPEASTARDGLMADIPPALQPDGGEAEALLRGLGEIAVHAAGFRRSLPDVGRARHLVERLARPDRPPGLAEELREVLDRLEREVTVRTERLEREAGAAQEVAERMRLVSTTVLVTPLERTARDAAQELAKEVAFEARGEALRVDPRVLAVVQQALLQVVRNAVAHGIERPAERAARGKDPRGRVTFEIERRDRRAAFTVLDDGRGVDVDAVRRIAEARGAASRGGAPFGHAEALQFLMQGGVTTARTVSEVAGRGVGLDVVREAVARLGGQVSLSTDPGRGTRVEILVPLALWSLEALVVESAGSAAALPLEAVRATLRLGAADLVRSAEGDSLLFQGDSVRFVALAVLLGHKPDPWRPGQTGRSAVVLEGRGGRIAVGVDRLLGVRSVLLRPLPPLAAAATGVAGVTLDVEGNPQLVLDPEEIAARVAHGSGTVADRGGVPPRLRVLIVDDSLTTRMLEQSILESSGYEVDLAASAEEALGQARQQRYALFLVDVEMPGMDGFAFVERTRLDPELRDIPSILVTSRNSADDKRRGAEVGARGYIVKSEFDQRQLIGAIRALVG